MKHSIYKIISVLLLFLSLQSFGQEQLDTYYYYRGEKVFLDINTKRISISFEGESSKNFFSTIGGLNATASEIVEDFARSTVNSLDQKASDRKNIKSFYVEIETSAQANIRDYRNQIENYKNNDHILMVSPTYTTKTGGEFGLSNNFYVKLKSSKDAALLYEKANEMNLEVLGNDKFMPLWFTLSIPSPRNLNALNYANLFYESGLYASTEPAFVYRDLQMSNDTLFDDQWYLLNTGQNGGTAGIDINAEQAWGITTGVSAIKTAVYDHGLEMNHPDLQANVHGTGFDANTGTSPATVRGSHGTACAGIVGAVQNNNLGVSGVAPGAELISISINLLFSDTPAQLASGFNWAWQNGADVISNSWGGYAPSSIIDDAITNTLNNGRGGKGCVIVFAAGNENNTNIRYPGSSNPDLLVVGAMSPCGERKNPSSCDGERWGSCFGTQLDVTAPGVLMPTTDRQGSAGYSSNDYAPRFNGTSSACPVVAGVAALVLSVNPDLTFEEVNNIIEESAQKVRTDLYTYSNTSGRPNGTWNNQMGYGLVDAHAAVLLAQQTGGCPDNLTITQNVPGGTTSNQQAANTITATNTIFNNATANYTAGQRLVFKTGFKAANGSNFKAKIQACTSRTSDLIAEKNTAEPIQMEKVNLDTTSQQFDDFQILPNPTNNEFTIITNQLKSLDNTAIKVYDVLGAVKLHENVSANHNKINVEMLSEGLYYVVLSTQKGTLISKKLLIQR